MVRKKKPPEIVDLSRNKSSYRTVKTSLKSIAKDNFQSELQNLVVRCNDIVIQTYQFIRLYCLYKYHHKQSIPTLDKEFIQYCTKTLGMRDNRGAKNENIQLGVELNKFYEDEFKPLIVNEKFNLINMTHVLVYLSGQIETCLNNNLKEHFIKRLLRFVNKIGGEYYDEKQGNPETKLQILKILKDALLDNKPENVPEIFKEWYDLHRSFILPEKASKSFAYDVKVNPSEYIAYSFYMNEQLEKKGHKLFQPLSLRSNIVPKYIILDTACFIELFAEWGTKAKLLKKVNENKVPVWNRHFHMDEKFFQQKGYKFKYYMETDGIGVSLLFIREDLKDKKYGSSIPKEDDKFFSIKDLSDNQLENLKEKNIVGVDPGKQSLVYMVSGDGNKLRYTASQRRIESLSKRNARIILSEKKKHNVIEKETALSDQNSKTVDYQKFKVFLIEKNKLNETLKEFYNRELFRKLKWRSYTYRRRSESRFLNKIHDTFGKDCVLAYGDWSRKSQMKYTMPTMGVGLRRIISKRFLTISVNEFNTSKKCCNCFNDLSQAKIGGEKLYRLMMCKGCVSTECKNTVFLTRDRNSAVNIMNLAKCWIYNKERPKEFCRNQKPALYPSGKK